MVVRVERQALWLPLGRRPRHHGSPLVRAAVLWARVGRGPMKRLRCAIYTRKSSEEGLEQDFNSLDAQREACEAYIKSQAGEGWRLIKTRYDDGGVSGGTLDRPGLQALLTDIEAGKVNVVVTYKVDRHYPKLPSGVYHRMS